MARITKFGSLKKLDLLFELFLSNLKFIFPSSKSDKNLKNLKQKFTFLLKKD